MPDQKSNILSFETVDLDDCTHSLVIIDQTKLPGEVKMLHLTEQEDIWQAINQLKVRGAPAIGIAAAIGIYLAAKSIITDNNDLFWETFIKAKSYLASARPTAVNLFWALDRMERVVLTARKAGKTVSEIKLLLRDEAINIRNEDIAICRAIGEHGLTLIKDGDGILTHCNAGQLATSRYGTALAPIHLGQERGLSFRVFADETRPLLQGVRLTAFELAANQIDVTVICDNMASQVMKNGWIQAIFVGADRVAANGDACNKIGTSGLAILAQHYKIPFYVCAPLSTIDFDTANGEAVPIEERAASEITDLWYKKRMAPQNIKVYNPAFDFADHELITAIVTENGIAVPPYSKSLSEIARVRFEPTA